MRVPVLEVRVRKMIAQMDRCGVTALYAREDAPHPLGFAIKKVKKELARLDGARASSQKVSP